ncbi:MAG: hypothetical protein HOV94_22165 [Saccharothrix sp.]|nr:hypothetical protein [Saccharothrix sp.]
MSRQFAVLLRGLPGTGKTTTAALLRDALPPSVRVSDDSVRYLAHPRDFTAFTLEASEAACLDLALSYCDSGFLPIIDGVFDDADFLAGQALRFERRGYQLITVSLAAEVDDLLRRNQARDRLQRMDEDRIRQLHAGFRLTGVPLGIRDKLPEEVCDDVLDIIELERTDIAPDDPGPNDPGTDEVDLLFLRHGEPDHPTDTHPDPSELPQLPLSARGRAEAVAARAAVRRFAPDVVLSSDSVDALETARLATARTGLDIETSEAARNRASTFFATLPERFGGKRVLVVGHSGPHSWLVGRALDADVRGVRLDTGCFSRFTLSPDGVHLVAMNTAPSAVIRGLHPGAA